MFSNKLRQLSLWASFFGLGLLICTSLLISINAILRKSIGLSFAGISDITENVIIISLACCFPLMVMRQSAITVRVVDYLLPKYAWYFRCWSLFSLAIFLLFMSIKLSQYSYELFGSGEHSWSLSIPAWPAWFFASFMLWISTILAFINSIQRRHS